VIFTIDVKVYPNIVHENNGYISNQMVEQFSLFKETSNSHWIEGQNLIIVVTKMDLLDDWLNTRPATRYLDYQSPKSTSIDRVEHYMQYLEAYFLGLIESEDRRRRTRILRANLVDFGDTSLAEEILQVLNELALSNSKDDS
jgi:hypothetical protein